MTGHALSLIQSLMFTVRAQVCTQTPGINMYQQGPKIDYYNAPKLRLGNQFKSIGVYVALKLICTTGYISIA